MSYILDALKKSDNERKQGDVPNLQTVHIPISVEPQTQWVLYGFITVLLLVLAFVIGMMISDGSSDSAIQQTGQSRDRDSEVDDGYAPEVKQKVASRQEIQKVTPQQTDEGLSNSTGQQPRKLDAVPVAEVEPVIQPQAISPGIKSKSHVPDLSKIPYLEELPDYQQQSIPEMVFAGHVYSTNPDNRSVIINDYFMSEGDTVVQGIDVVEITTSGVVFSFHDTYFRMDILLDWSFEE